MPIAKMHDSNVCSTCGMMSCVEISCDSTSCLEHDISEREYRDLNASERSRLRFDDVLSPEMFFGEH